MSRSRSLDKEVSEAYHIAEEFPASPTDESPGDVRFL